MAFDFVDDDDNSIRFADKTGTKKFSEHFPKKADIKGMKTKNKSESEIQAFCRHLFFIGRPRRVSSAALQDTGRLCLACRVRHRLKKSVKKEIC